MIKLNIKKILIKKIKKIIKDTSKNSVNRTIKITTTIVLCLCVVPVFGIFFTSCSWCTVAITEICKKFSRNYLIFIVLLLIFLIFLIGFFVAGGRRSSPPNINDESPQYGSTIKMFYHPRPAGKKTSFY